MDDSLPEDSDDDFEETEAKVAAPSKAELEPTPPVTPAQNGGTKVADLNPTLLRTPSSETKPVPGNSNDVSLVLAPLQQTLLPVAQQQQSANVPAPKVAIKPISRPNEMHSETTPARPAGKAETELLLPASTRSDTTTDLNSALGFSTPRGRFRERGSSSSPRSSQLATPRRSVLQSKANTTLGSDDTPVSAVQREPRLGRQAPAPQQEWPPLAVTRIMRGVPGDAPVSEIIRRLDGESWVSADGFDRRAGVTALAWPWPSAGCELNTTVATAQRSEGDQDSGWPLRLHVANALSAVARACEAADRCREAGICYVTDVFDIDADSLASVCGTDAALETFINASPPLMQLQRALSRSCERLCLVIPMPTVMLERVDAVRRLLPAHIVVAVERVSCRGLLRSTGAIREERFALKLLVAITRCGTRPPRRALAVIIDQTDAASDRSSDMHCLVQLAFCARHGVRVLMLELPAARVSALLLEMWPKRSSALIDPAMMQACLQRGLGNHATEGIDNLHELLAVGEHLAVHPVGSSVDRLQRLCVGELCGDRALLHARAQHHKYLVTARTYAWSRAMVSSASILLALAATVIAVLLSDIHLSREHAGVRFVMGERVPHLRPELIICAVLPALLAVFEVADGLLVSEEAAVAAERAAGLVAQTTYVYRCRAGEYSDAALSRASLRIAADAHCDLTTLRQRQLNRNLAAIAVDLDEAGAFVTSAAGALRPDAVFATGVRRLPRWRLWQCWPMNDEESLGVDRSSTDLLGIDEYLSERVQAQTNHSLCRARWLRVCVLTARTWSVLSAGIGMSVALLGMAHLVVISVAASVAATRLLRTSQLEGRQRAHARAASRMLAARARWEALPAEARYRQNEVDALVLMVEHAMESVLPAAPHGVAGIHAKQMNAIDMIDADNDAASWLSESAYAFKR